MKILQREDYRTMPWPNGRGVAHEIFHIQRQGHTVWRLSLADVVGECVFSRFEGLTRCTTVVSGAGMDLEGTDGRIMLRPRSPVTFSGELQLHGTLVDGPVKNLNLVYDSNLAAPNIQVQTGTTGIEAGSIVFVVSGELIVNKSTIKPHGTVWTDDATPSGAGEYVVVRVAQ